MGRVVFTISLPEDVKQAIDLLVDVGLFKSRSALIEYLVKSLLLALKMAIRSIDIREEAGGIEDITKILEAFTDALRKSLELSQTIIKVNLSELLLDKEKREKLLALTELV